MREQLKALRRRTIDLAALFERRRGCLAAWDHCRFLKMLNKAVISLNVKLMERRIME